MSKRFLRVFPEGSTVPLIEITDEGISVQDDLSPEDARRVIDVLAHKVRGFYLLSQDGARDPVMAEEVARLREQLRERGGEVPDATP